MCRQSVCIASRVLIVVSQIFHLLLINKTLIKSSLFSLLFVNIHPQTFFLSNDSISILYLRMQFYTFNNLYESIISYYYYYKYVYIVIFYYLIDIFKPLTPLNTSTTFHEQNMIGRFI